jgi:hypothetical protein
MPTLDSSGFILILEFFNAFLSNFFWKEKYIPNTDDFQQKIMLSSLVITKKPKAFVVILLRQKCLLRRKCLFFWITTPATQVRYDGRIAKNHWY